MSIEGKGGPPSFVGTASEAAYGTPAAEAVIERHWFEVSRNKRWHLPNVNGGITATVSCLKCYVPFETEHEVEGLREVPREITWRAACPKCGAGHVIVATNTECPPPPQPEL